MTNREKEMHIYDSYVVSYGFFALLFRLGIITNFTRPNTKMVSRYINDLANLREREES